MKYCKRILRTNENYLINTKVNSNVLTNRDKIDKLIKVGSETLILKVKTQFNHKIKVVRVD